MRSLRETSLSSTSRRRPTPISYNPAMFAFFLSREITVTTDFYHRRDDETEGRNNRETSRDELP